MTTLLLIRHGQSLANLTRFFAGHTDVALTDLGLRQAECTAEFVVSRYPIARVYASVAAKILTKASAIAPKRRSIQDLLR